MAIDVKSPVAVYVGTGVSGAGATGSVVFKGLSILQTISVTVAIVAGLLSAVLAGIRIWKELKKK